LIQLLQLLWVRLAWAEQAQLEQGLLVVIHLFRF
jgi:hypothetical protein